MEIKVKFRSIIVSVIQHYLKYYAISRLPYYLLLKYFIVYLPILYLTISLSIYSFLLLKQILAKKFSPQHVTRNTKAWNHRKIWCQIRSNTQEENEVNRRISTSQIRLPGLWKTQCQKILRRNLEV